MLLIQADTDLVRTTVKSRQARSMLARGFRDTGIQGAGREMIDDSLRCGKGILGDERALVPARVGD